MLNVLVMQWYKLYIKYELDFIKKYMFETPPLAQGLSSSRTPLNLEFQYTCIVTNDWNQ